ncbi:MAG: portal protein, partial [Candidatus Cloacimonetes bacterium]|nr:portal protein [Candidatus Cloacimonadota bacterium]
MPANWLVWDRIREFTRANRIYQQERILQDQSSIDKLAVGGDFLDFSSQNAILQQTNLQINRLERYKDYEQMDQTGEISLALDLYADECSLIDPEYKHGLIIRAANRRIKQDLEELFFDTLLIDRWLRPAARYLCKFGDAAFEVVTDRNRTGVSSLRFMNIYNFTRIETRFGDLVGFFYQDEMYPEPVFMHPWSCMHMRLTNFESVYAPYGRAVIDGSRKPFKQLRLMEDASLIYRITRGPEKRKYKIPVGMIPPKEVPEYLMNIARMFKRQRFYNPTTGTFDERFSPIVQEDDFFLPMRPDGTGPDIEVLPGGENMDKISDIEYFKKKMVSPLKIPFARVGIGEGAGEPNEKSLSQTDAEFAKAVQWIQSEMALSLQKIGI